MRSLALAPALALLGVALPLAAQQPEQGAFVVQLGQDTVAAESFQRTPQRLEGRVVMRTPRLSLREYSAELDASGRIRRFLVRFRAPDETTPYASAVMDFGADTTRVELRQGESTRVLHVPAGLGSVPFLSGSLALYEPALAAAAAAGADSVLLQEIPVGADSPSPLVLRRTAPGEWEIENFEGVSRARVGPDGHILAWNGLPSTFKVVSQRLPALDVDALAHGFAVEEKGGRAMGVLSPHDSVLAAVGPAHLRVDYSRPARRGRRIMGNVVPWNVVWRTGANEATLLRTDRDLEIGGQLVPAGSYSLWTLPATDGWKLIVNRQTGQWGTEYDPGQDLARIDMRVENLAPPVERFAIAIEPAGSAARLALLWDDVRVWVPIRAK